MINIIVCAVSDGRDYFSEDNFRLNVVTDQGWRKLILGDIAFEILLLMNDSHVLTACLRIDAMARGKFLFVGTCFGPGEKSHALDVPATMVDTHHKTGTGNHHQKGEGKRQYGTYNLHSR